jgi:DNA polymerase III delta prime subunit
MNLNDVSNLWVEKYRPKSLADFVISNANHEIIKSFSIKGQIPNLLLAGKQGLGKTSLAKIIVNDILKCQYLYINASDENGIDTIRTKVTSFSQTRSIDGNIKVVILDEADGISLEGQRALRNTMEEFSNITRFILTANYKYRIIPALQSRCQNFDLTPPLDGCIKRCVTILKNEKIEIDAEQKATLFDFIKSCYPDLRSCINELQKFSATGKLKIYNFKNEELVSLIYKEIKAKNVNALRKALIENETSFNSDYISLLRSLFKYVEDKETNDELKKKALIIIAEHLYRSSFVSDQEINCFSCFILLSDPALFSVLR